MSIMKTIWNAIRNHIRRPDPKPTESGAPGTTAGTQASESGLTLAQEVDAFLTAKAQAKLPEKLDWKHSIVDLMKVLDLDSSFAARKELAADLKYRGTIEDSAVMNNWLHAQVMQGVMEDEFKD